MTIGVHMVEPTSDGISVIVLTALAITAFVAGLARGFSGFGSALIFIPLASAIIGPKSAVPLLQIVDSVLTLGLIPSAWHLANRREVGTMALGAVAGVPLGTFLLISTDALMLRWAIAVLAAAMLVLLTSGWRYHSKPRPWTTVGIGLMAGTSSGAAAIGGPPVVAYWLGGVFPPTTVRANIVLYFAVSSVFSMSSYFVGGLLTKSVFSMALMAAPAYGLGLFVDRSSSEWRVRSLFGEFAMR